MQNYALLLEAGTSQHPVLLKRGFSATIEELLMAAEYILSNGNQQVMLCERGIRTFETATRNTTDINAIPVLQSQTHLPVIIDPSHSTGHWEYVTKVAQAGIAAGADGLIIEVHNDPSKALSDGEQSLKPERFFELVTRVRKIAEAVGRSVHEPVPQKELKKDMQVETENDRSDCSFRRKIAIVGLGLMGGSLAMALKDKCKMVIGIDTDPEAITYALENGIVDRGINNNQ